MDYLRIITQCHPSQNHRELVEVLGIVKPLAPKVILEIGADRCGSLCVWERILRPDLLIGVDDTTTPIERVKELGLNAVIIAPVESQTDEALRLVKQALGGSEVDFLHIDGGHTFKEVKGDFENYSGLVRRGGLIMLHDIAVSNDDPSFCEVQRFWKSIRDGLNFKEIIYGVGTGLIFC